MTRSNRTMLLAFCLYTVGTIVATTTDPCSWSSSACSVLGLTGLDAPHLWIYIGVVGTLFYGICYYVVVEDAIGPEIKLGTLLILAVLGLAAAYIARSVVAHLTISLILTVSFFTADLTLADRTKDVAKRAVYAVQCYFISLPTIIAIAGILLYYFIASTRQPRLMNEPQLQAFVAGAAAFSLASSNGAFTILNLSDGKEWSGTMRVRPQHIFLTIVCAGMIAVLAFYAAITTTVVPGVAALYPAAGVEVVFGIWFGIWGALGSYIGLLIAGSFGGWFPLHTGVILSMSDFFMALVPWLLFRLLKGDARLTRTRDYALLIIGGLLLASVPTSLLYNYVNLRLGVLPGREAFWVGVVSWNVGNAIVIPVLGILLLKSLTGFVQRSGLGVGMRRTDVDGPVRERV